MVTLYVIIPWNVREEKVESYRRLYGTGLGGKKKYIYIYILYIYKISLCTAYQPKLYYLAITNSSADLQR